MSAPTEGPLGQTLTASASGAPTVEDLVVASRLLDSERYELRGEHGRGGLGVVLRAFDRQLGREVALKVLQNDAPAARRRFLREATITSRLQHPSIVTVHDVVQLAGGTPSYTMPLYPGRSLRVAIQECADLRARLALLSKVLAVCEAIAHAHGRQVIHRDIKPSNVLLGSLGETVVIDWGLAKSLDDGDVDPSFTSIDPDTGPDETRTGDVMGTPAYMAPEQARGERVDQRADIYALGALLYHVLSGHPPYRGRETGQLLRQLLQGPPPDMDADLRDAPPELVAILRKAMAREPGDRYASADALAEDLRRFLNGVLVEAHEYTTRQLVARWVARHRVLVATVGLAVAVLAVVIALAFRRVQDERGVAQASAAHEKSRANAMILTQAETILAKDPTRAIAWLKSYPDDGEDWVRLRAIARDAVQEGVARHALRRSMAAGVTMLRRAGGRQLLMLDGERALRRWDVASGDSQVVACFADDVISDLRDETSGHEVALLLADGEVLVWSEASGAPELVARVPGARSASLSSDGRWLAIADGVGPATLVDRRSGAIAPLAEGDLPVVDARFVPGTDRLLLLGGNEGSARPALYDVVERRVVARFLPGVSSVQVAAQRPAFVLVRPESLDWIDARDLSMSSQSARLQLFHPLDFTDDGRVAFADRQTKRVQLWDPRRDALTPLSVRAAALGVSPGGRTVASMGSDSIATESLVSRTTRNLLGQSKSLGRTVTFLDEDVVASSTDDGATRLWELGEPPGEVLTLGRTGYDPPFALVDDGSALVVGAQDGRVLRRRLDDGRETELFHVETEVANLAATPDGRVILIEDGRGQLVRHDARGTEALTGGLERFLGLVLTGDGRYAAAARMHGGSVYVWDLERRRQRRIDDLRGDCFTMRVAPDQRSIAIGCSQGAGRGVTLHDLERGTDRILAAPGADLRLMGFSPSGRYLFASLLDGRVIRWEVASGAATVRPLLAQRLTGGAVLSDDLLAIFATDSVHLASFGLGVATPLDASARVAWGSFARDGSRLVAQGIDDYAAVYAWDLRTRERWIGLRLRTSREARVGANGQVVAAGMNGTLHIYEPELPATTPAQTRAWLDRLTSIGITDETAQAELVCP